MLRQRFLRDMDRRFNQLAVDVYRFLVVEDAFGLLPPPVTRLNLNTRYKFLTKDEKLAQFNKWFKKQVNEGVLGTDAGTSKKEPWTSQYTSSAYRQGIIRAFVDARKTDMLKSLDFYSGTRAQFLQHAFAQPERTSKIRMLGTRAFEELKGVTSQMASQMNIIMADGIANGRHPKDIAREMSKNIKGISKSRARTIARTETIHAHAEGQLDGFEDLGVDEVGVQAEWLTAGDARVCPRCNSHSGNIYTVKQARGLIPLHPNCRCAWSPVVDTSSSKTGRKKRSRVTDEEAELLAIVVPGTRSGSQAEAINTVIGAVPKTAQQISQETGIPVGRVHAHMQSLDKKGLVEKTDAGWVERVGAPRPPVPPVLTPVPVPPAAVKPTIKRKTYGTLNDAGKDLYNEHRVIFTSSDKLDEKQAMKQAVDTELQLRIMKSKLKPEVMDRPVTYRMLSDRLVLGDSVATYEPALKRIEIGTYASVKRTSEPVFGKWVVDTSFGGSFRHEYGHHVWYTSFTPLQKQNWDDIWRSMKTNEKKATVSKYAASHPEELWAESFCAYTHPEYKRGSLPLVIEEFLDKAIGVSNATGT